MKYDDWDDYVEPYEEPTPFWKKFAEAVCLAIFFIIILLLGFGLGK